MNRIVLAALLLSGCAASTTCPGQLEPGGVPAGYYRFEAVRVSDGGCIRSHTMVVPFDGSVVPGVCEPVDVCGGSAVFTCAFGDDTIEYDANLIWEGDGLSGEAHLRYLDADGNLVCEGDYAITVMPSHGEKG